MGRKKDRHRSRSASNEDRARSVNDDDDRIDQRRRGTVTDYSYSKSKYKEAFSEKDKRHKTKSQHRRRDSDVSSELPVKKIKRRASSSSTDDDTNSISNTKQTARRNNSKTSSKHKKQKYEHSSKESSENDDDNIQRMKKLSADAISKIKAKKRREYEVMKALETPEQKRARRLAKKEAKERKRKAQMGWDDEYMGYTNTDNPFGDEQLLETFVWGKKHEKEGRKHFDEKEIEQHQRMKMEEQRIELEKVKKRRLEREREMAERENERELTQRQKEAENFKEWEKQEDSFHLQQAKLRSKIRIEDSRAKPIDLLAKYVSAEDDDYAIEMQEPYTYLSGLTVEDLEDLLVDIKVYIELEEGKNAQYWEDITVIVEDELQRLQKMEAAAREEIIRDRRQGINTSVVNEVASVFKGKTHMQLELLEKQVRQKLRGGEGVDIGYWESLLQQLLAHMALTRLRERHQENLRRKLFKLKEEQGIENQTHLFPIVKEEEVSPPAATIQRSESPQPSTSAHNPGDPDPAEDVENEEEGEDMETSRYDDYHQGNYSPRLFQPGDMDIDTVIYDPEDDLKKLEYMRRQVQTTGQVRDDTESEFIKKAREGMNDDEAQFSVELALEQQSFLWSDKYRPRKPRFFNRVHTGFEWNKYNQTHYDIDNPPPKIVQGYKFNIFYPDLIDKTATPQYTITPLEGDEDFAMLKFKAGPPYEDIAFKVVNREWEYSWKRGFRCQFHNNIFQLWYHFKRYRYRR